MLSDFIMLEAYYGPPAAVFFEDLSRRYGAATIHGALGAGDLVARPVFLGPDKGRWIVGLSGRGRLKAGLQILG